MPGDRFQERRLASLQLIAQRGRGVVADLCELAEQEAGNVALGIHEHLGLEL
jgi:hypothetical protein